MLMFHSHKLSRVFTLPLKNRFGFAYGKKTYRVCLECGREFDYDLEEMRLVKDQKVKGRVVEEIVR